MLHLPADYISFMSERVCSDVVQRFAEGLQEPSPVSIRLNPARLPEGAEPVGAVACVPWCAEGRYLASRPSFTADPLLHAGAYYVQEASSMFLAHALHHSSFVTRHSSLSPSPVFHSALDLCAAPGGKSTLLRSLLPPSTPLVVNEALPKRAAVLAENIAKWGAHNTLCTNAYADELGQFKGVFDLIVADVPCSGEGMFRKEPDAVEGWSVAAVERLSALQRDIIADIWPALAEGGILIYSTCTLNPLEDEDNVDWIARELGADIVPLSVPSNWNILGDLRSSANPQSNSQFTIDNSQEIIHNSQFTIDDSQLGELYSSSAICHSSSVIPHSSFPYCHLLPGFVQGEGFFLAVLRKHGQSDVSEAIQTLCRPKGKKNKTKAKGGNIHAEQQTSHSGNPLLDAVAQRVKTLPTDLLDAPAGTPAVELTLADSLRYLQRESIVLPSSAPQGLVQLCYQGQRLGIAKNLGSRANNLYPKEWRIRSQYFEPNTLFP